jgi:cytoskeletal protein CcmA (bactofilin family)
MFGVGGKVDTMIGEGAEFKGNLNIKGSIFVDGRIEGNIRADDRITMGEQGHVKGNLVAQEIVVSGNVQGNLLASGRVELLSTAVVDGDIRTPRLMIEDGSVFEGNCEMDQAEEKAVEVKFGQQAQKK